MKITSKKNGKSITITRKQAQRPYVKLQNLVSKDKKKYG